MSGSLDGQVSSQLMGLVGGKFRAIVGCQVGGQVAVQLDG